MNYENIDMNQMKQIQEMEEMKRRVLGKILAKDANERLSRVRMVNQQLAGEAEHYLLQLFQSGKLQSQVSDESLAEILKLLSQKKETRIKRR